MKRLSIGLILRSADPIEVGQTVTLYSVSNGEQVSLGERLGNQTERTVSVAD